jgi:glutamate synthase (NADPH/NADH) small chain
LRTQLGVAEPGKPHPFSIQTGTDLELETDWVITALGFDSQPCPCTRDFNALSVNKVGELIVDANRMTSIPGIFAGGDLVNGPSPILEAVRDARQAAAGIHAYLSKQMEARTPSSPS